MSGVAESETPEVRERHANNLELFLDLVFVFAVTQIATLVGTDLSASNLAKGALIAALVWWQWSQFTWTGSALDLQRGAGTRTLVLGTIPAALTMATAIPLAFTHSGAWFGFAYLVVQLLVLGMMASASLAKAATRDSFIRYASAAALAPVIVAVGGLTPGNTRVGFWVAAMAANIFGAFRGAGGEWVIDPVHFAERHALFVIISLGESLVAIGATATNAGLSGTTFGGLAATAAVASLLWWTYFSFIPEVAERQLRVAAGAARGRIARDLFTFGHFPIVAGIIAYAIVAKHVVAHPFDVLHTPDRTLLAVAVGLVIAGLLHMQWRVVHRLAPERITAIGAVALLAAVGGALNAVAIIAVTAAIVATAQTITLRRYTNDPFAPIDSKTS